MSVDVREGVRIKNEKEKKGEETRMSHPVVEVCSCRGGRQQ